METSSVQVFGHTPFGFSDIFSFSHSDGVFPKDFFGRARCVISSLARLRRLRPYPFQDELIQVRDLAYATMTILLPSHSSISHMDRISRPLSFSCESSQSVSDACGARVFVSVYDSRVNCTYSPFRLSDGSSGH